MMNSEQNQLFQKMTHSLRCMVCQNQSLADSEAGLSKELRQEIYQQIVSNKSEAEILAIMTTRYGDKILYQPPLNHSTYLLWFGPFILLLMGILMFRKFVNFNFNFSFNFNPNLKKHKP